MKNCEKHIQQNELFAISIPILMLISPTTVYVLLFVAISFPTKKKITLYQKLCQLTMENEKKKIHIDWFYVFM